jgi:hypothetical protein
MPIVQKLSPEEGSSLENECKDVRRLGAEQYDQILADFGVSDYGELIFRPDEKPRLTARRRLAAAASRRGLFLTFLLSEGDTICFRVSAGHMDR